MAKLLVGGLLALAVAVPVVVVKHRERMRNAEFAGEFEYDFSQFEVNEPPRRVLTLRPDGRWTLVTTLPGFARGAHVDWDSGSYRISKVTLALRSDKGRLPATFTISGDTLYARTARMHEAMERMVGRPLPAQEELLVRISHVH